MQIEPRKSAGTVRIRRVELVTIDTIDVMVVVILDGRGTLTNLAGSESDRTADVYLPIYRQAL